MPLNVLLIASLIWIGVNALPVGVIGLALLKERTPPTRPAHPPTTTLHPSVG